MFGSLSTKFSGLIKTSKYFTVSALAVFALFQAGHIFFGHTQAADKDTISVKVVGISDGDTITVLTANKQQLRVRLAGIDAPERSQAYGMKARKHLADQVFGKIIELETRGTDKYKRTLGIVFLNDQDINELMIKDGYAWFYRQYASSQPDEEVARYAEAEESAKSEGLGLWAGSDPMPPWTYRKEQKKNAN
jgi:micrococcal nuclease